MPAAPVLMLAHAGVVVLSDREAQRRIGRLGDRREEDAEGASRADDRIGHEPHAGVSLFAPPSAFAKASSRAPAETKLNSVSAAPRSPAGDASA